MKKHLHRLMRLILYSDLHATRIVLCISELIWGISLLMPGDTFSRSKTYSGMAYIADEPTWGVIWLISGIAQGIIVWTGCYHSQPSVWFAGVNSFIWWLVVVSLYSCVWPMNSVASGDIALAIASTWVWVRSGWTPEKIHEA
jgi:hypothetical protein